MTVAWGIHEYTDFLLQVYDWLVWFNCWKCRNREYGKCKREITCFMDFYCTEKYLLYNFTDRINSNEGAFIRDTSLIDKCVLE